MEKSWPPHQVQEHPKLCGHHGHLRFVNCHHEAVLCRINWGCWVHPGPTTDLGDESLTSTAMLLTGTLSLLPELRACLLGGQARSRSKHIWTNDSYPGRKFMPATTCYHQHTSHLGPTMSCLNIMASLLVTSVNLLLRTPQRPSTLALPSARHRSAMRSVTSSKVQRTTCFVDTSGVGQALSWVRLISLLLTANIMNRLQ